MQQASEQFTNALLESAAELVEQLIEIRERDVPPFLAEEFAQIKGVKKIIRTELGEVGAVLVRFEDGYIIKVNTAHHPVRQNFSMAHEIGHILLDECQRVSQPSEEYRNGSNVSSKLKERLCDIVAVELLMPRKAFSRALNDVDLSMASIEHLAQTFRVSVPSAALRVTELCVAPCRVVMWRPSWQGRVKRVMRAQWSVGHEADKLPGWKDVLPRGSIARQSSAPFAAYMAADTVESPKYLELESGKRRCVMQSKGFGSGVNRYVVSLVVAKQPGPLWRSTANKM